MKKAKILTLIAVIIISIILIFYSFQLFLGVSAVLLAFFIGRLAGNNRIDRKNSKYR